MSRIEPTEGLLPSLFDRLADPEAGGTAARPGYGVEQMIPSHGTLPRSSPPTAHSSSTIRPSSPEVTTTSLTAT